MSGWRGRLSTARVPLAVVCLLASGLSWVVAWPGRATVGPLVRVPPPSAEPKYVHPVLQIARMEPSVSFLWVSDFLDLGPGSVVSAIADAGSKVYVRSAWRQRSFRIARPPEVDQPFLGWQPLAGARECRRYVQLAVIPSGASGADAARAPVLEVAYRAPRRRLATLLALSGALLLAAPRARPWGAAIRRRWGAALLCAIVLVNVSLLWARHPTNGDENRVIAPSKGLLLKGNFVVEKYEYPHVLIYAHAAGRILYGFYRIASGSLAHHDPYTNQLYFDGRPWGQARALFEDYAERFGEESNGPIRKLYLLVGAAGVLLLYELARRAGGTEMAGFFAGAALAVQPLYLEQSTYILPNAPGAVAAVVFALSLLRPVAPARRLFLLSMLCGFVSGFKYNPTFALVLSGLVWLDVPPKSRLRSLGVVFAGVYLGFLAAYPSLPLRVHHFIRDVSREAFHYGYGGHRGYEADAVLGVVPELISFAPPYWGNYAVAALALVGGLVGIAKLFSPGERRLAWVLLGLPILNLAFSAALMVQFARHYCIFLTFVCLLAGIGASFVIGVLESATGRRRAVATGCGLAVVILSTGRDLWLGRAVWERRPTAREQAIAWIDGHAPLGSRVCVVEPATAQFQGLMVDRARYGVVRLGLAGRLIPEECDYVLTSEAQTLPSGFEAAKKFEGFRFFGLPAEYAVYLSTGASDPSPSPRPPPNEPPPQGRPGSGEDEDEAYDSNGALGTRFVPASGRERTRRRRFRRR